jgi:hypothetical protein
MWHTTNYSTLLTTNKNTMMLHLSHLKRIFPLAISCCTIALSILIWTFT